MREPKNASERECFRELRARGFKPTKRGWPDFLVFRGRALVGAVEVKPKATNPLKTTQVRVMAALQRAGIKVQRFDPETGFTDFNEEEEARRRSESKTASNRRFKAMLEGAKKSP